MLIVPLKNARRTLDSLEVGNRRYRSAGKSSTLYSHLRLVTRLALLATLRSSSIGCLFYLVIFRSARDSVSHETDVRQTGW